MFLSKNRLFKKNDYWPVYLKDPKKDLSSLGASLIIQDLLNKEKANFQILKIVEIGNYTYCPNTKIYLNHKSFNTGDETHLIEIDQNILGSVVIRVSDEYLSNWRTMMVFNKTIEFITRSFDIFHIIQNTDSSLFNDNFSQKVGFTLIMESEEIHLRFITINVYFDISHEFGNYVLNY